MFEVHQVSKMALLMLYFLGFVSLVCMWYQSHVREKSGGVFSQESLFKFKPVMGCYLDTTWSEPWYELLQMSRSDEYWPTGILWENFPLYI